MIDELSRLVERDKRYRVEAYLFVLEALNYTLSRIGVKRHVTGRELVEGIRDLARERYGMMVKEVFRHWGVRETLDFGQIVFNLIEIKLLSKTDEDKLDDFRDIFDFDEAFLRSYPIQVKKERR
jgi:uncharacterized repeat protein (TIGR04138 family)